MLAVYELICYLLNMAGDIVVKKANEFAHSVYRLSRDFPKDEIFGLISQLRRSGLSVPLNLIEGYARQSRKSEIHFLRISYGSLQEVRYLIDFAVDEGFLALEDILPVAALGDELARLIWSKTRTISNKM